MSYEVEVKRLMYPWRHIKRQSTYRIIGEGLAQCSIGPIQDNDAVIIYQNKEGDYFIRKPSEFYDKNRFEDLNGST